MSTVIRQIVAAAKTPRQKKKKPKINQQTVLSSGSTLLNLACSGNPYGAFLKGRYYYIVGDSESGKTFTSMTCFAEATYHPVFRNYSFYYDNVEDGCLLDLENLFNSEVARKVEPPCRDEDGSPVYSGTVEDFYYHVDDAILKAEESKKPFLYVLDSMDALTSEAADAKFDDNKKAHRAGKEAKGSYGDGKAKKNSEGLRRLIKGLSSTGSILIIVSQTRDNIGFGFDPKTRAGGRALKFYATLEIWTSITKQIKKTVRGKPRAIGVHIEARLKKNRITGIKHNVPMAIYPTYGIDDVGVCVDWLLSEKWWKKVKSAIKATEIGVTASRDVLISTIESSPDGADKLKGAVWDCWKAIQKGCAIPRKKKYRGL